MMDRNREARRAAAMTNGLPRRRHRTTTGGSGSTRESPEDDGPVELQETAARLRDRTAKKERDREMRERDRDRERERERLRSKRRRGDKYMHRDGGGGGVDDSSEESVNDEDEDDDGFVRYVPPSNPVPISSTSAASTLTSHRKSYPPPSKLFRVAPTWKAPDEMIGVSIPRKARSASTKRGHDCWSSAGGVGGGSGGEQVNGQASSSPVRSTMTATPSPAPSTAPSPSSAPPLSPSHSNFTVKKKIKANGTAPKHHQQHQHQQRPPKTMSKSSPSIQDEIEIEVAEVLYGLMRQSHAPLKQQDGTTPNDSARSIADSKSRVSSPLQTNNSNPSTSSSVPLPLTTIAPKRKRPRSYPEETPSGLGPRSSPIPKSESDQAPKLETAVEKINETEEVPSNGVFSDGKQMVEESVRMVRVTAKVEEASSSSPTKMESLHIRNHDHVESSTTTSTRPNSENHREDKFEIDLMAPPSPEREEEMAEYGGGDEKSMVTDREAACTKPKEEEVKSSNNGSVDLNTAEAKNSRDKVEVSKHPLPISQPLLQQQQQLNFNSSSGSKEKNIDLQFDLEKCSSLNEDKLNLQKQPAPPPKAATRDDANTDKSGVQSGTAPLPMSVPGGWHGGLPPMGYVGPLQGVVSMDGTPMASPPIQSPHSLFSQPRPKRCATHCYVARSISVHQQVMKMNPFWPAAAAVAVAGTAPLFGAKPYNLNMVPSADLHAAAAGRGVVVNSSQDNKGQPFTFFPGQPASSMKDKSPQPPNVPDSAQKKQFLLQPTLNPGATGNIMHGPAALFFPMGQQQAAVPNARPSSTKLPSAGGNAASTSSATSAPIGVAPASSNSGHAMSFSYPNMGGNETQFMAILGNGPYPYPIPAHVGSAPPYRGTHPQAMSFFNSSFYSSQMLHPAQVQQQQQASQPSQSMQIQQQNQQNGSLSTASSSSQKHLQHQQPRPQGNSVPNSGNPNQGLQNFQATKGWIPQSHHDVGGEDSPSTADSRNRPNMSVYGQNFAMPFHSPNFAMMTPPSSMGGYAAGVLGDKKQQQSQQTPAFPMSFATINGSTTPGLDISSIAQNHTIMQSLPEAARPNYQMMAAAAAAQAAQQKKNNYRVAEDGKSGVNAATDSSSADEERKTMAARASAASAGQSIAFSRDFAENSMSTMPGNNVIDTSARSLNMIHGSSARPTRSPGPNSVSNSNASNPQQQQQQQQQQMLFAKQQQYGVPSAASGRSKTPTSNGNAYSDHLNSSSVMAAKFPNSLSGFPPLVQTSGAPVQSPQWKNSVRPNTSLQVSSPSVPTSTASNMKNHLPQQQQGRSQQNHTQISFGATAANSKASSTSQGQQNQHHNQAPPSPMIVGSPSNSSVSKGASGSPRTTASASTGSKGGAQGPTLSSQQGKNSQSPSLSSQKPSILGSPHIMSTSTSKPQVQQSQQQPQLSKQSIQQAQLFFSNAYMQASANTSAAMAGSGYYIQRHRPDSQQQQQQQQGSKSQGSGPPTSSSGMLSLCAPVSLAHTSTTDPAKAVAAAAFANNMKAVMPSQGIFHAAQFAAQSAGGTHQLMPAGFPYVHAVSSAVQVKPAEQKQPAGE